MAHGKLPFAGIIHDSIQPQLVIGRVLFKVHGPHEVVPGLGRRREGGKKSRSRVIYSWLINGVWLR